MVSDEKLIRKITRYNDRQAADELFECYYRKVYAYVFRQCGERELAMEFTQEIFMAVFQGLHGFDGRRTAFRTWLYRVAANKTTDYYRSRRYREGLRGYHPHKDTHTTHANTSLYETYGKIRNQYKPPDLFDCEKITLHTKEQVCSRGELLQGH